MDGRNLKSQDDLNAYRDGLKSTEITSSGQGNASQLLLKAQHFGISSHALPHLPCLLLAAMIQVIRDATVVREVEDTAGEKMLVDAAGRKYVSSDIIQFTTPDGKKHVRLQRILLLKNSDPRVLNQRVTIAVPAEHGFKLTFEIRNSLPVPTFHVVDVGKALAFVKTNGSQATRLFMTMNPINGEIGTVYVGNAEDVLPGKIGPLTLYTDPYVKDVPAAAAAYYSKEDSRGYTELGGLFATPDYLFLHAVTNPDAAQAAYTTYFGASPEATDPLTNYSLMVKDMMDERGYLRFEELVAAFKSM